MKTPAQGAPAPSAPRHSCFTPGPWRIERRALLAGPGFGFCIAEVFSGGAASLAEADANGRLLAAAPDLYHALRLALVVVVGINGDGLYNTEEATLRTALAKVHGGAA